MFAKEQKDGISKNRNAKAIVQQSVNRECKQPNQWEINEREMELQRDVTGVGVGTITG